MTYSECLDYLFNSLPVYQRIGAAAYKADLNNTHALMQHFEHPENKFKSIHVAGTNGKGSVSHNLASIFQEAGYKTGLYTSPHLRDFRERIRVNGHKICESFVIDFTKSNRAFFEQLRPSFFEMTVAMAFVYFATENVDIAIVETGMGGRLDSTNVITPQLSIITNISYDHTQFLGDSLCAIAKEKAGIIKEHVPVVIGETQPETKEIFIETAKEKQAEIIFADQLFDVEEENTVLENNNFLAFFKAKNKMSTRFTHYVSPLAGKYQLNNFKTVLAACRCIGSDILPEKFIQAGIKNCVKNTELMGRWQVLQENPLCIADTGHNKAGITLICKQIKQMQYDTLHFVISMVNDKNTAEILSILPKDAMYYFCKANIPRGLDVDILYKEAQQAHLQGAIYHSVNEAFNAAKKNAKAQDLVFVGGSTFTVAEVV
jgi:dihydrofolate synthase/folylpolyglutamate synthase